MRFDLGQVFINVELLGQYSTYVLDGLTLIGVFLWLMV